MGCLYKTSGFVLLIILAYSFLNFNIRQNDYERELNNLILEFKNGVETDEEFEDLYDKFDELEDDIDDYHKQVKTQKSQILLEKIEALAALVGELSPDGRNFTLTLDKYRIAAPLLDVTAYIHPTLEEDDVYCLGVVQFFLWNDNYQALLILNDTQNLVRFESTVLKTNDINSDNVTEILGKAGVDCNSLRGMSGFFTTSEGLLQCTSLTCTQTPHCINK